MERWVTAFGATLAVLTALIGSTIAVESRYAKAVEVKQQLDEFYARQIKLRILEIDLKQQQSPSDKALKEYLLQELNKGKNN